MISKEELIKLYVDNKMSATEISKILKCDRKTVGNYLRRYDIPIRSAKETKVINEKQNGTYITIEDIIERIEKGYLIRLVTFVGKMDIILEIIKMQLKSKVTL